METKVQTTLGVQLNQRNSYHSYRGPQSTHLPCVVMGPPAKKLVSLALAVLSPDETRPGPGRCLCSAKFHHWTGPIAGTEPLCRSRSRLLPGSVSQLYRTGFLPSKGLLPIASRLPCLCSASCLSYSFCIFFFSTALSIYYIVPWRHGYLSDFFTATSLDLENYLACNRCSINVCGVNEQVQYGNENKSAIQRWNHQRLQNSWDSV